MNKLFKDLYLIIVQQNRMAAGAKLQKSFEDYFRIPILLKGLGNISQQKISQIASIFNLIDNFPINEDFFTSDSAEISKQKIKKNQQVYDRIIKDMKSRSNYQSYKLLFLSDQFDNDWSEFEIVYRVSFVILVYSGDESKQNISKQPPGPFRNSNDTTVSSIGDLNEKISKISIRLKEKDKELLGIMFLNDTQQFAKALLPGIKFTIVPPSLPYEQLSMFIEPWVIDLIPIIERNLIQHMIESRYEQNCIIVFNRSEEKSQPKIMKKKKKFRCLKICGDLALMLHLYQFAYQSYHQADEQLRKVDDWLWVLGCIQGKLACMTSNAQLNIKEQNLDSQIEQLIEESFIYSKKVKYISFQVQNTFKILKLLLHQDKKRFDDMVENMFTTTKGLTEEEKFLFYSYVGSLYEKAGMERKRNFYYFKASLIIEKFKPQISELLLKTIKKSHYIKEWEELNSKVIQKIIEGETYFSPDGQLHLQLIQNCSGVLTPKEIQSIKEYLNYGNFEEKEVEGNGQLLIEVKELNIVESSIKPKPNRLISDESPKKATTSGIFVGWKKKLTYIYEQQEPIILKGTILNKLPFEIRIRINLQLVNSDQKVPEFSLILPSSHPYKFSKQILFPFSDQPISIRKIKFSIWNYVLYKVVEPEICFELYQKQPRFQLQVEGGSKVIEEKQKIIVQTEQSSYLSLRCSLRKTNDIECDRLRITCSIYYDIDVGFQENQFILSTENNFHNIELALEQNVPNIRFLQSKQKQSSFEYSQDEKMLVLKLKKFKTTRDHVKKIQINLDFIKQKSSKYQLNRQYTIEPKIVNSVWANIVQISTPELQSAVNNMRNLSQAEIEQFHKNWNTLEDYFLAKIRFQKDKFNLKPFKVWYEHNQSTKSEVIGKSQVILSNLTEGQMWLRLAKIKVTEQQKLAILEQQQRAENQLEQLMTPLHFRWQNIVNKNMQGYINLNVKKSPLIFAPRLAFSVDIENITDSSVQNCKLYKLSYTIASQQGEQIKPHRLSVKAFTESVVSGESTYNEDSNTGESISNENSNSSNMSILIKGKTKIKNIKSMKVSHNQFRNVLDLRIIEEKQNHGIHKQQNHEVSIMVGIQFEQRQIGKWQKVLKLI